MRQDEAHTSDNESRVQLRVMGISYTQIQQGAYALILAEVNGPYRIPVVVGASEAQSIAMKMEEIVPPRPLAHDLFATLMQAYGLTLIDVFISKFEDGIFSAELTFENMEGHRVVLDARTSDAIAIAMRTGTSIFTTPAIVKETGFLLEEVQKSKSDQEEVKTESQEETLPMESNDLASYTLDQLEASLQELIVNEEYEEAARIQAEIKRKKSENK